MEQSLKTTPLVDIHRRSGARLAPFGGWLMPIHYEGIIAEHQWTRTNAGLFDICHMGEFVIEGDPATNGLQRLLTVNLTTAPIGRCRYGFFLNENGGILDDLIVYKIVSGKFMLVVNAATTASDPRRLPAASLPGYQPRRPCRPRNTILTSVLLSPEDALSSCIGFLMPPFGGVSCRCGGASNPDR